MTITNDLSRLANNANVIVNAITTNGTAITSINVGGVAINSSGLGGSPVTFANDVTISGNLTVSGTTVTVNTTTLDVKDLNITIAKGAGSAAAANGAGLTVDSGYANLYFSSSANAWTSTVGFNVLNGSVGVGTSSIYGSAKIHAESTDNWPQIWAVGSNNNVGVALRNTGSGGKTWSLTSTNVNAGAGAGKLRISYANNDLSWGVADAVVMDANTGNVGIGNTNPSAKLVVTGTPGAVQLRAGTSNGYFETNAFDAAAVYCVIGGANLTSGNFGTQANVPCNFMANNTGYMTLAANGNFGVGTNAPTRKLHVTGTTYLNNSLVPTTGISTAALQIEGGYGGGIGFYDGSYRWVLNSAGDTFYFAYANSASEDITGKWAIAYSNTKIVSIGSNTLNIGTAAYHVANGNLGLGVSTPSAMIALYKNAGTFGDPSNTTTPSISIYNANVSSTTAHSTLFLGCNGGNSGNPFVSYDISGIIGWCHGIDNADSDKFKISSAWNSLSSATRFTIDTAGNVGIACTAPTYALTVGGSAWFNATGGSLFIDDGKHKSINWNDGTGNFTIKAGLIAYANASGTYDYYAKGVGESNGGAAKMTFSTDNSDGYILMYTSNIGVANTLASVTQNYFSNTSWVTLTTSTGSLNLVGANVGINTTDVTNAKLNISTTGNGLYIRNTINSWGMVCSTTSNNSSGFWAESGGNYQMALRDANANLSTIATTGGTLQLWNRIQVGTSSATNFASGTGTLHVGSGIVTYGASATVAFNWHTTCGASNNSFSFYNGNYGAGGIKVYFKTDGGIANYSGSNINLSDENVKKDIVLASDYLDKICAIPVKNFRYKDTDSGNRLLLGVIAQDVEAVAPELVDNRGFGETPEGQEPLKSIYQTDIMFALMKAIQELKVELDATKAELQTLKG